MTLDDVVQTIKAADAAYVAFQTAEAAWHQQPSDAGRREALDVASAEYAGALSRASTALELWERRPWLIERPTPDPIEAAAG